MSLKTKGLLAIIVVSALWGTAGVAKPLVRTFDPFTVAFLRFAVATVIILPFFLRERVNHRSLLRNLIPVSIFSALNVALYYLGLTTSTATSATIVYTATPLVVAAIAHWWLKEQLTPKKLAGIFLGIAGAIMVVAIPALEQGVPISGDPRGNFFFAAAVFSWAIYTIGSRRVMTQQGYSPLSVTAVSLVVSCVVFLALMLLSPYQRQWIELVNPDTIALLVYLGLGVTVATFFLYQWIIQRVGATTASVYLYLQTLFAVLFNVVYLQEVLTPWVAIGGAMVLTGVFLATRATRQKKGS